MMKLSDLSVNDILVNPSILQATLIHDLEDRFGNGNRIASGNSVVAHCLEMFAKSSTDLMRASEDKNNALYPIRTQTMDDLYRHMSDFDHAGIYASPASIDISMILDKRQIINDAVVVNANYSKLVIPTSTVVTIDKYAFGLYYPIEIRVNRETDTIVVTYDTTHSNPLHTLVQNTIEHRIIEYHGVAMVSIKVPVYQFKTVKYKDSASKTTGFSKKYTYTDRFYAVRAYYGTDDTSWTELSIALSSEVYDPLVPTAQITVDSVANTCRVTIPQVYLTEEMITGQIRVELFSTVGAIDADISTIGQDAISIGLPSSGDAEVDKYTNPLQKTSTLEAAPISQKIIGGRDEVSFEELRNRVIYNTLHEKLLLTPADIEYYFNDIGFRVSKYRDGITNRTFLCHKQLTDRKDAIIAAANVPTLLTKDDLTDKCRYSVNDNYDNSYTILPSTVYKYDATTGACKPISDFEREILNILTRKERVIEYNDNIYTGLPYHIRLDTNYRGPAAYVYDFTAPKVESVEFIAENIHVLTQMTVYDVAVEHREGKFTLNLEVVKSSDIADIDPSMIKIVGIMTSNLEVLTTVEATFVSAGTDADTWEIELTTNYDIDQYDTINISSLSNAIGVTGHGINIQDKMRLVFMVNKSAVDRGLNLPTEVGNIISGTYSDYLPITEQELDIRLGDRIDTVFSDVDVVFSEKKFRQYDSDAYLTYDVDQYERDGDGVPMHTVDGGGVVTLNKLHSAGDIVRNSETVLLSADNVANYYGSIVVDDGETLAVGNEDTYIGTLRELLVPVILHRVGDTEYDPATGLPIIDKDREVQYLVTLPQINRRIDQSERVEHAGFMNQQAELLRSYYDVIVEARPLLIEETDMKFVPLRSMGTAEFRRSATASIHLDLELTIRLKLHVYSHVKGDNRLQQSIRKKVIAIIDAAVTTGNVSMTEVADQVRSSMSDMIKYVDVLGINNMGDLQTLINIDEDIVPSLKQELVLEEDGTIGVERALYLEYAVIE